MTVELLPRLKPVTAEVLWRQIADGAGKDLPTPLPVDHQVAIYTATGGSRVQPGRLDDIRRDLVEVATNHGYPHEATDRQKTTFDAKCARYLAEDSRLHHAECLRPGVWAFFSLVLLPDLTAWRFSRGARERWVGGIRNTFGMLWRRGYLLGAEHGELQESWGVLDRLTQDALVQIVERPGIAGNPVVARAIADGWIDLADRIGQRNMETIARTAIRWLGAYRRAYDFDSLPPNLLRSWIRDIFMRAAKAEGFEL